MMLTDSCSWDTPGSSPYTGRSDVAIMAMQPLPLDVRQRLAARPLDSFDHFVYVDRDSVRTTGATFGPSVSWLNFGTGSRVCGQATRANWKPSAVETAIVFCDAQSGYCVGKFSVCSNFAIFNRLGVDQPPTIPHDSIAAAVPPEVGSDLPEAVYLPVLPSSAGVEGSYGQAYAPTWGPVYLNGPVLMYLPPDQVPPPGQVSSIPEPKIMGLLLAGIGLIVWRTWRR